MKSNDKTIIAALLSGKGAKKYEGKEVVVMNGKVYLLPSNDEKSKQFLNNLIAKHPKSIPTIVDVPTHEIYILYSAA